VDVSEEMIGQARQGVAADNVVYLLTDGVDLPLVDDSVHAIFSTHVLQHLDNSETVTAYFLEFFRVLRPGGSILIHVPLYEWPGAGRIATLLRGIHGLLLYISQARAWVRRRTGAKLMRGTAMNTSSLCAALSTMGFREVEFRTFATSRNGIFHSCVMAKK
jgi:SAM-dependent methyltransferase